MIIKLVLFSDYAFVEIELQPTGIPKLFVDGYEFQRELIKNNSIFWRCRYTKTYKCKCRCITVDGNLKFKNGIYCKFGHNHLQGERSEPGEIVMTYNIDSDGRKYSIPRQRAY